LTEHQLTAEVDWDVRGCYNEPGSKFNHIGALPLSRGNGMSVEDEAKKFWGEKEKEKGGKVSFYTFATYYGQSGDQAHNLSGLLYKVDGRLYFEDFEKESWFLKLLNRKSNYEKTEFLIPVNEIVGTRLVTRSSALNCIEGFIGISETRSMSGLLRVFAKPLVQINMMNAKAFFFEIMKLNEFRNVIGK
jgi:hypothetical protein